MGRLVSNWFTVSLALTHPPPGWCVGSTGAGGGGGLDGGRGEYVWPCAGAGGEVGRLRLKLRRDVSGDSDWYGAKSMFVFFVE